MRLQSDQPEATVKLRVCPKCARPCDEDCPVWGYVLCGDCFAIWLDEAPEAAEAERRSTVEQLAASRAVGGLTSAFYEAWTKAWLKGAA